MSDLLWLNLNNIMSLQNNEVFSSHLAIIIELDLDSHKITRKKMPINTTKLFFLEKGLACPKRPEENIKTQA